MASRAIDDFCAESDARAWFTAAELAELALPGLPADKRAINRRAQEERWSIRCGGDDAPLVRPRAGRGGGVEFHVSLLPGAARLELARRGLTGERPAPEPVDADIGGWRWYEAQSDAVHAEAERRLGVIGEADLLEESGMTRTSAIADVAARAGVSTPTLWSWLKLLDGVAPHDRLPALAPRRRGGGRAAEIDPALWLIFKSDYLRGAQPTLTSCYERTADIAAARGLSLPSEKTMRRRLEAEVDPRIIMLRREGSEAVRRSIPAQRRTVDHLFALECVNVDGHKFDVRVTPPGGGDPVRPMLVGIQDVRSSKIVAWRVGEVESAVQTRLAFADLFRNFGIPKEAVLDNGRAFASKWITGGMLNRNRFKVKQEEPTGLLTGLGIKVHWTIPYRGQSKPIERAWRDFCDRISRSPEAEGAYTGNNTVNKPHNYGQRAMKWEDFLALVEREVARHNARLGRRGRDYRGRSFDQVFAESYAAAPIGKATAEHLRMALLAAEQVRVDRQTGEIKLFGNRYWAEDCGLLHGKLVTVRFDPDSLHSEVHLYDGSTFLLTAPVIADTGFMDVEGAKATAKRLADYKKRVRAGLEAEGLLAAEELAALQAQAIAPTLPEPGAVRPVRHRGQTAAALKPRATPRRAVTDSDQAIDRMARGLKHLRVVE